MEYSVSYQEYGYSGNYWDYDGSKNHFKIYNTSSGTVETREYYNTDTRLNAASWNQKGFVTGGDGSTTTRLAYHNIVDNEYVVIADFSQNRPRNSQFSPDGDFVYFCFYGETENYFCKTADLSAGSEIDTLYSYSKEIVDWLVVK